MLAAIAGEVRLCLGHKHMQLVHFCNDQNHRPRPLQMSCGRQTGRRVGGSRLNDTDGAGFFYKLIRQEARR